MQLPSPTPGSPMMPQPPMGGTGAATAMRPQMGNLAQSLTMVHTGLEALQKALVGIPMGSELHTALLKSITDISKRLDNSQGDKASQVQGLATMARDLQANPQQAAMQRAMGGGGQPQPPAMPQPGAG